jgi:hypothetical protein
MKIFILLILFFPFCSAYSGGNNIIKLDPDSSIRGIFSEYQKALKSHDVAFPQKWFITNVEYHKLLDYVTKWQPNCVGPDEATFTTETNSRLYNDILTSNVIINQISVSRIEYNYSCGNLLEIPRVICTIQYSDKKVLEVPFLLVKTTNNEFKILKNFLNYKLLSNE